MVSFSSVFIIFTGSVDSIIQSILRKFEGSTGLSCTADTIEERDAVQRDLDRWSRASLMKFNKDKCKVLHLHQGNAKHKHRLSEGWVESNLEEKDLDKKLNMIRQCALAAQKASLILSYVKTAQSSRSGR